MNGCSIKISTALYSTCILISKEELGVTMRGSGCVTSILEVVMAMLGVGTTAYTNNTVKLTEENSDNMSCNL